MNLQQDPFVAISEALATALKALVPQLKTAEIGWPDTRWLGVDGNLPAVFFVDLTETGKNISNRLDVHKTTVNPDGTGYIYTEQLRLFKLIQTSLFTNTKPDRANIGWTIKQYMVKNYRLPLTDGEFALFKFKGDHSDAGETNLYQRDLTFEVTARVLDATPANRVTVLNPDTTIS